MDFFYLYLDGVNVKDVCFSGFCFIGIIVSEIFLEEVVEVDGVVDLDVV